MPKADRRTGTLTHREMVDIVEQGGSVLYNGEIITNVDDLPSAAALAKGNSAQEQAVRESLQAQIARLQGELSLVSASTPAPAPEPEKPEDDDKGDQTAGKDKGKP